MAGSDDIDLYAILGVSKRSSISDIKKVRVMVAQVVPSGELEHSVLVVG